MDGFGSLAALILGAMVLMVAVPALVLGLLAHRVWGSGIATASGVLLGVSLGATAVAATFYSEQITRPTLQLEPPAGFEHEWVIVLVDPTVERRLEWTGVLARSATLQIPSGGVVRVAALPEPFRSDIDVVLGSGPHNMGLVGRPVPAALRATHMVAFSFVAFEEQQEPDLSLMDDAELVARVLALEAE